MEAVKGPEEQFRAGLAEGRFMIQRSRSTGAYVFYPRPFVPGTGETDLEWVEASGEGTVHSTTVNRRSPEKGGSPTYRAADIAYLADKLDRGFDRLLYVLGADHHGTRNWYAAVARMLGFDPARVEVLLYQLVHLTRGGELARMSKRRGDVVFLDELVDEIGVDAARWYLVDRGPDQTIEIDVDLAAEKTRKNPVYYVQYVHARTSGIRREAGGAEPAADPAGPLSREERDLVRSYSLGVNAFVVKPVGFEQFFEAIRDLGMFWAVLNEPPPRGQARNGA